MKKLIFAVMALGMLLGCNNDNTVQIEGEPLIVREDVVTTCDEKFEFKVTGGGDHSF